MESGRRARRRSTEPKWANFCPTAAYDAAERACVCRLEHERGRPLHVQAGARSAATAGAGYDNAAPPRLLAATRCFCSDRHGALVDRSWVSPMNRTFGTAEASSCFVTGRIGMTCEAATLGVSLAASPCAMRCCSHFAWSRRSSSEKGSCCCRSFGPACSPDRRLRRLRAARRRGLRLSLFRVSPSSRPTPSSCSVRTISPRRPPGIDPITAMTAAGELVVIAGGSAGFDQPPRPARRRSDADKTDGDAAASAVSSIRPSGAQHR